MIKENQQASILAGKSELNSAEIKELQEYSIKATDRLLKKYFHIAGLDKEPTKFDTFRYVLLKKKTMILANGGRTVDIMNGLLDTIFHTSDAHSAMNETGSLGESQANKNLLDCVNMKFKLVEDMAVVSRVSVKDILGFADHKIHSKITELVLLHPQVLNFVDHYIGLHAYKSKILNTSWFHLLEEGNLSFEKINNGLVQLKTLTGHPFISMSEIQQNLAPLIAEIAVCDRSMAQKKQLLQVTKQVFGFESDQQLVQLYYSATKNDFCFEIQVLRHLTESLGLDKRYFLEQKMREIKPYQTLAYYMLDQYIENNFFKKSSTQTEQDQKIKRFLGALEFLNKHIKRDAIASSDFIVAFLEDFNLQFPKILQANIYSKIERQNSILCFMRAVEILITRQNTIDDHFKQALVTKVLYVLKLTIENEDTVEMGIYSLQILTNAIGIKHTIQIFGSVFCLVVQAYLSFSHKKRVSSYVRKIIEFYIRDKKTNSIERFKDIQFLFLKELQKNPKIASVVKLVAAELYSTKDEIAKNLKDHVQMLQTANIDIRLLGVAYILEILEQPEQNEIRKVLVSKDVLKFVYQVISQLRQRKVTLKNKKIGVLCAKVIATIGLCHSFVNDPLILKANNQESLNNQIQSGLNQAPNNQHLEESKVAGEGLANGNQPNVIKSDHYNPIFNMKYGANRSDNTLEVLAIPSFSQLPIDMESPLDFARNLHGIVTELTQKTEELPKNFYFTMYLLHQFIAKQEAQKVQEGGQRGDNLINEQNVYGTGGGGEAGNENMTLEYKNEVLSKAVKRFVGVDLDNYRSLESFEVNGSNGAAYQNKGVHQKSNPLNYFAIYLIQKIEDPCWQSVFEACIPLLKRSVNFLHILVPYLLYYALRFNDSYATDKLPTDISKFLNEALEMSQNEQSIETLLRSFDFLKIATEKDKKIFKQFIEAETKFKYVEKLFCLELEENSQDSNIKSFVRIVKNSNTVRQSFMSVKKVKILISKVDKNKKYVAARTINNYKNCVYNTEDIFRQAVNTAANQGKGLLDTLSPDQAIEIVNLKKNLHPEDFDTPHFNEILQSEVSFGFQAKQNQNQTCHTFRDQNMEEINNKFQKLIDLKINRAVVQEWKSGNCQHLGEWLGDFDLSLVCKTNKYCEQISLLGKADQEDPIARFEIVMSLIFAQYQTGLKALLQADNFVEGDPQFDTFMSSLGTIRQVLDHLYFELKGQLECQQGEVSYYHKLFLHATYEVESAIIFLKDIILAEKDRISELLKREVNKKKRSFEKLYNDLNLSEHFQKLVGWFQERTQEVEASPKSLRLIYFIRRVFFMLYDRENEYAYYTMQLAKLHRKIQADALVVDRLFKNCEKLSHKIVDFELEYAKYMLKIKNAHEAYQYLVDKLPTIEQKVETMTKDIGFAWQPTRVVQKAKLLAIELQIKIDQRNPDILDKFSDFVKSKSVEKWEKPHFKFAAYLDKLDQKSGYNGGKKIESLPADQQRKRNIQKIFYYTKSLQCGHKYIWQSLPRALELWFDYQDDADDNKIQMYMRQELLKLESFKVATALQILLSRFGHHKDMVRETIVLVLSKLAVQYPSQCAWWIFHLHFFDDSSAPKANFGAAKFNQPKQAITRAEFAKNLIKQILIRDAEVGEKIMKCESLLGDLKKLCERPPAKQDEKTMNIPKSLGNVSHTNLVMPIEENLSPQLPPKNYQRNFIQKALVKTTGFMTSHDPHNVAFEDDQNAFGGANEEESKEKEELDSFPAYKKNPTMISGFLQQVTIMLSKEKPKKIGILGSDKRVYNFLLKCDKFGDLRKEQRFIDFAGLCNKMLENDPEAQKRNLKLRTYAIVPLSRNTGLIEWIQHTATLKSVVGDYWKKNNIRGEMQEIKKKAQELGKGDTHTSIWPEVKKDIKPVLGDWFADHFPSADLWYEARVNFIKSTAIWSMLGYVIGLGDRHGDNILIHQLTGEVTHVDFDCIFEKGARLKIPEIVPFRLTSNIMDVFGIFKEKGVFQKSCEVVLRVLRKNQSNIISFLYSFNHDPLVEASQNIKVEINDALTVVKQKLNGQVSIDMGEDGALTIEEQVEQVILNAISEDSIKKMYIGWMPWL